MDEDQQQEGQQEQRISSSAFTSFNITPAPRRPISSLALFQRKSAESDEQIRGVVRKNQQAITTINLTLVNVTSQLRELSLSLTKVSLGIKDSAAIENLRIAQEQKQAQMLADRNARRGVENNLEKGIQAALFKPVQRIGAKAKFTLAKLVQFFNLLLGGFLVGRAIKVIETLVNNGGEGLKNIGDTIIKQLTAAGGIFVAINGGLLVALSSLTKLASFLTQVAVTNLLLKPIGLIFKIAKSAAAAIIGGATGGGVVPPLGGGSGKNRGKGKGKGKGKFPKGINSALAALSFFGFAEANIRLNDADRTRETVKAGGGFLSYLGLNRLGNSLQRSKNPFLSSFGKGLNFFAPFLGFQISDSVVGPTYDLLTQSAVMDSMTTDPSDSFNESIEKIRQGNTKINVLPQVREQNTAPLSAEGRAALLMFSPPNNKKNPYLYNSYVQYNVIPF